MSSTLDTPTDKYQQWFDAAVSSLITFNVEHREEMERIKAADAVAAAAAAAEEPSKVQEDVPDSTVNVARKVDDPTEDAETTTTTTTTAPQEELEKATAATASSPSPPKRVPTPLASSSEDPSSPQSTITRRIEDGGDEGAVSTLKVPNVSTFTSCKLAQKYLKELVDASQSAKLAERLCIFVEPLVATYQKYAISLCTEPFLAMLLATFISNLAAHTTVTSDLIDGSFLVDFLLVLGQHHRRIKKVIIAILSAISNVMYLDRIALPADVAEVMIVLIAPLYYEVSVVEVWAGAVANIVIRCPDSWERFIQADATSTIQRLLVYFGDEPRILRSGLHCLTALSMPTIVPQQPRKMMQSVSSKKIPPVPPSKVPHAPPAALQQKALPGPSAK